MPTVLPPVLPEPDDDAPLPRTGAPGDGITLAAVVGDDEVPGLIGIMEEAGRVARGAPAISELLLVDATDAGLPTDELPATPGLAVRWLRVAEWSRGRAWRRVAGVASGAFVAWMLPDVEHEAGWPERVVARLAGAPEAVLAVPALRLRRSDGSLSSPLAPGPELLPPCWEAGLVARREALARVPETAFHPVELAFYLAALRDGAVVPVADPLVVVPHRLAAARQPLLDLDRRRVGRRAEPGTPPRVTVAVFTDATTPPRATLAALARQDLGDGGPPGGGLDVVVLEPPDRPWSARVAGLPTPFSLRFAPAPARAPALARAVELARGEHLVLLDAALEPEPGWLAAHLAVHRDLAPGRVVVLGERHHRTGTALARCLDTWRPGEGEPPRRTLIPARRLDAGHASLPVASLRAVRLPEPEVADELVGGVLGLRLEGLGLHAFVEPEARVADRREPDLAGWERERRRRARALPDALRHCPELVDDLDAHEITAEAIAAEIGSLAPHAPLVRRAAAGMGAMDLDAVAALGGPYAEHARHHLDHLRRALDWIGRLALLEGLAEGLRAAGLPGIAPLLVDNPLDLPGVPPGALLVVPDDAGRWRHAVRGHLAAGQHPVLLKTDARGVVEGSVLVAEAGELLRRVRAITGREPPPVRVLESHLHPGQELRLLAAVAGWVPTGGGADARLERQAALASLPRTAPALPGAIAAAPLDLDVRAAWRLLAWPDWGDEAALRRLARACRPLAEVDVALCLRHLSAVDGPLSTGIRRLGDALAAELHAPDAVEVLVVDDPLATSDLPRLGAAVDARVDLAADASRDLAPTGAPPLGPAGDDPEAPARAIATWAERLATLEPPEPPPVTVLGTTGPGAP